MTRSTSSPIKPLLLERIWDRLGPDPAGLLLGAVFFVLALTPSLLPRDLLVQGVACGLCAGTGYLLGVWLSWNWRTWIRTAVRALWASSGWSLPAWWPRWKRRVEIVLSLVVVLLLNGILLGAVHWQQEVAALTDSRAYTPAQYLLVFPVGFGLWMLLAMIGRGFLRLEDWLRRHLPQRLPMPVRSMSAWIIVIVLIFALVNHAIPGLIISGAESAFSMRNDADPPNTARPMAAERSGSSDSSVPWETLGAYGKRFVGRGLSAQGLQEITSRPAVEPIRVYAGLKSADTDEARAALVVEELKRTGAASRSAVMIAPTTGTGWVNPIAALSLELLYDGDTAIAAAQYFITLYPYVYATGDLTDFRAMSAATCKFCESVIANTTSMHTAGGWEDPWEHHITFTSISDDPSTPDRYVVELNLASDEHVSHRIGEPPKTYEASQGPILIQLLWKDGTGWTIEGVKTQ